MAVALSYTPFTLFTLLKLLYTAQTVACMPSYETLRQLQMFQKVEFGGGPIFKVVLEC